MELSLNDIPESILSDMAEMVGEDLQGILSRSMETAKKERNKKNAVLNAVLRSRNFEEEISHFINGLEDQDIYPTAPVVRAPERLKNKSFFDLICGLKIYNNHGLLKFLSLAFCRKELDRSEEKRIKSACVFTFSAGPDSVNCGDIHSTFINAPCYRSMVWGLKELDLVNLKKFSDFDNLVSIDNDALVNFTSAFESIERVTDHKLFNKYHTKSILSVYISSLKSFKHRPLDDLSDDEHNALSFIMFGYSKIINNDLAFLAITSSIYPESLTLASKYLVIKTLRDNYLLMLDLESNVDLGVLSVLHGLNEVSEASREYGVDLKGLSSLDLLVHDTQSILSLHDSLSKNIESAFKFYIKSWNYCFIEIVEQMNKILAFGNELVEAKGMDLAKSDLIFLHDSANITISILNSEIIDMPQGPGVSNLINEVAISASSFTPLISYISIEREYLKLISDYNMEKEKSIGYISSGDTDMAIRSVQLLKEKECEISKLLKRVSINISNFNEEIDHCIGKYKASQNKNEQHTNKEKTSSSDSESELVKSLQQVNYDLDLKFKSVTEKLSKSQAEVLSLKGALHKKNANFDSGVPTVMRKILFEKYNAQDVLNCILEIYPHVVVSDNFDKIIASCEYEMPQKLLKFLCLLCEDYYKSIINGVPDSEAKNIIGQVYRANESDTSMQSSIARANREFYFDGKRKLFTRHLTIGSNHNTRKTCQVYFDIVDDVMQIAYVGEHLSLT